MTQVTYYTILRGRVAYIVKYAVSPTYEVKLFSGAFTDPSEASQEFKKTVQGRLECLTEGAFERKSSFLSARYLQDKAKLADWNSGRTIRI